MYKRSPAFVLGIALALGALAKAQQDEEGFAYDANIPNNQDMDFSRVRAAGTELQFNFDEVIVNPNEKVQLDCGIIGEYRYCVWEKENEIYQVEDVYEAVYSGMSKPEITEGNQCGIVVEQATIEDHGMWTCKIYIKGTALQGTKNVIITVKPTQAEVSPQQITANADDQQDVECSVMAARPAVKINWVLNGKDITHEAQAEERPTNPDGTYMTLSTLSHVFKAEENGQDLQCVVAHHTLAEPEVTNVPITVVYAPIQKPVQTFYQIPLHSEYEIKLDFSANPRPTTLEWFYGNDFQEMPNTIAIPNNEGDFATSFVDLENGNFQAVLKIASINEEIFATKFKLHVANEQGEANYRVMLSMNEQPIDDVTTIEPSGPKSVLTDSKTLSGGAIAAIIVVLLLVVVVIGVAGFTRYKQMFCFAPRAGSKAYIDQEGGNVDNGNANDAIKASTDHINGKTPADNGIVNGNGNLEHTKVDNDTSIDKKNTDV